MMKGTLEKNTDGEWVVKYSDLHSFGFGDHWSYMKLSDDSNEIKYLENNQVMCKPLEEGLKIEFESHYNPKSPFDLYAKLVFPEVQIFEDNELIKQYYLQNNIGIIIDDIAVMRDGGTLKLVNLGSKEYPFYIHKDNWTLHSGYPTTDDNLITDKPTQTYILHRLKRYKETCEYKLNKVAEVIKNFKK